MTKEWQEMANHLIKLGFMKPAIDYIINKIDNMLGRFDSKKQAIKIVSMMFARYVDNLFSEQELKDFLLSIDPYQISNLELELRLGIRDDETDRMSQEELKEYHLDRIDFLVRRRSEKIQDLSILKKEETYTVLRSRIYR